MKKRKLTENREKVYRCINNAASPLSAPKIVVSLKKEMDHATVYRSLQFLESEGYISSFLLEYGTKGVLKYYVDESGSHHHFFHCERCHNFMPVEECSQEKLSGLEKRHGIRIKSHSICYTGLCSKCMNSD